MKSMIGQDFKTIVEEFCVTNHIKKTIVARQMGISKVTLNLYEKHGVPASKLPLVMSRLKEFKLDLVGSR